MKNTSSERRGRSAAVKILLGLGLSLCPAAEAPTGQWILQQVDANEVSNTRVVVSQMVVRLARLSRTIRAKSWIAGTERSFTEFLAPEREKGTKMLKLGDELWIYTPASDRTIKLSGHMLRQSVMGSDLSYEDMMEDNRLSAAYDAQVSGEDTLLDRACWVLDLVGRREDLAYSSRRIWVDKERFLVLREDRFAKSGTLLKTAEVASVSQQSGRWVADRAVFRDMLKAGEGTEFILDSIAFDVPIPDYLLTKAALRK